MKFFNRSVKVNGDLQITGSKLTTLKTKVFPVVNPVAATVNTKTADYTILASELNGIFDNTGDIGLQVLTLPTVVGNRGKCLKINVLAAQVIRALPQTGEAINLNGSAVVTKYLNIAAVIGNCCDLYCDGTQWIVTGYSGVVTKEA